MTEEQRRNEYRRLFRFVPGINSTEKLQWVAAKLGVGHYTVKAWNTEKRNPIPESKLALFKILVSKELSEISDCLRGEVSHQTV